MYVWHALISTMFRSSIGPYSQKVHLYRTLQSVGKGTVKQKGNAKEKEKRRIKKGNSGLRYISLI